MTLPSLRLKANAERRLRAGHLWVYSNEVDVAATPLNAFAAGDQAVLQMANGKPLGIAVKGGLFKKGQPTDEDIKKALAWADEISKM